MAAKKEHIAFSDAVKAVQVRKGSRDQYEKITERSPLRTQISEDLAKFISSVRSAYLATASSDGQPYVQHRGGPPGFVQILDSNTIAFVDFKGNRQFVSQGNLTENPKAFLFLMDYRDRRRIKVWGRAEVRDDQPEILVEAMERLGAYKASPEQMIYFHVAAWEVNCKQHIPIRYEEEDVAVLLEERDSRIGELERQVEELKQGR